MNDQKLVSIIIVNWNGRKWLKACLESLYSQEYKNFEIILVDNASTDNSVKFVEEYFTKVKVIKNKENFGFAEGNNIGYKHVSGDYVLFLNNDTRVTKTFLTILIRTLDEDAQIGCVQSKILLMDSPDYLDSVGSYLTPTGFLYHYGIQKKDQQKYNRNIYIYSAKGACMLFRRSVLKKIEIEGNIFDSRFFCYFEETDLAHRVWLSGYKIMYVPESVIYHKMGATSSKLENSFVQFHSFKNRINAHFKNLGLARLSIVLPLHLLVCEFFALISLAGKNRKIFFVIQNAIRWNILEIKNTLRFRKIVQTTIRQKSDKDINKYIYKYPHLNYYFHIGDLSKYEDYEQF